MNRYPLPPIVSLFALVLIGSSATAPAPTRDEDTWSKVDDLFASVDRTDSPGTAVGIYRAGRLVHAKGYGMADLEQGIAITPQTVFHLASVSKQFTAMAIALLNREGRIDLEADIRTYLPFVPDLGHRITVNHLLHHTSGLRDQWALLALGGQDLDGCIRQQQILNLAGAQFHSGD